MDQNFGQIQIIVKRSPSEIIEELGSSLVSRKDARFQRFYDYEPFPVYVDWWKDKATTNVVVGGNKSGKTYQGILNDVMIFTGIVPPSLKELYPHPIPIHRERHVRIIGNRVKLNR